MALNMYVQTKTKKETYMYTEKIDELEVLILEKRLEVLKSKGLTGRLMFELGDDFFALMDDKCVNAGPIMQRRPD